MPDLPDAERAVEHRRPGKQLLKTPGATDAGVCVEPSSALVPCRCSAACRLDSYCQMGWLKAPRCRMQQPRKGSFHAPCAQDELQLCVTLETPAEAGRTRVYRALVHSRGRNKQPDSIWGCDSDSLATTRSACFASCNHRQKWPRPHARRSSAAGCLRS